MRTIKFRAWDKDRKIMMYGIETAYDTLGSMTNREGNIEYDYYDSSFGSCLKNPDYEIMQFTGLHDKNGKEVWEGDIVKILERDWPSQLDSFPELTHEQYLEKLTSIARVVFDDGGFRLSRITANNYYFEYAGHTNKRDIFEVIGNIYENPELLEGGK